LEGPEKAIKKKKDIFYDLLKLKSAFQNDRKYVKNRQSNFNQCLLYS